jgi:capsular polysaccharide biosynthesis protein
VKDRQEQNLMVIKASSNDDEISLIDILYFLKSAYKPTLVLAAVGLAIAVFYLMVTPKQYEAVAQIAMAQISASNNNNPLGINIEEPSLLIARLSQPTSFPTQVLSSCGFDESANAAAALSKSIKLALSKGVANVVELKTFGESPEAALTCAQAIFGLIKITQAQIVAPYIVEAKLKLADDSERLAKAKDLVAKADKSGSVMGAVYLSTRDEIRFLLDEITALKNVVTSNQSRATQLIAPIYASDTPIAPKKRVVLAVGLFGGLFLGLLFAFARQLWIKLKADALDHGQGA